MIPLSSYKLCPDCGCPMKPKNVTKRVNEYDHAMGCPRGIVVGAHVRVIHTKPDGKTPHPHAGKTGAVIELMGVYLTGPDWNPRAQVRIDQGQEQAGNVMVVSLTCLERI